LVSRADNTASTAILEGSVWVSTLVVTAYLPRRAADGTAGLRVAYIGTFVIDTFQILIAAAF
jgi:hypothetical protein